MDKSKLTLVARVILGGAMVVFGLNGFLQFIPMPTPPAPAMDFLSALGRTGYFFPFLKISEIVAGAMVLTGVYLPLGLLILAPILLNIVLFHIFLEPGLSGMALPLVLVLAELYLAKENMDVFGPILKK
jgi:uncharacterized membrane protein YphA (DoxX/SURF4 family)